VALVRELAPSSVSRARLAALDRDFAEFAARWNLSDPDGPAVFEYEYPLVLARTVAASVRRRG
jgi:hypothetical protein